MRTFEAGEKQLTAGALLISQTRPQKVLLVFHQKAQSWLQPGGHVESAENPIETTIREVKEETGIDISFIKHHIKDAGDEGSFLPVPDFFLEEVIPAHGDEPEHYHLDLIYVIGVEEHAIHPSVGESTQIGWFSKAEALQLPLFKNTEMMIKKVLV